MHAGKKIRSWRQAQKVSAATLARMLPEPLTDGQMIYRYEKSSEWFGSEANGRWLVEQGALPADALPNHSDADTVNEAARPAKDSAAAASVQPPASETSRQTPARDVA